jgi:hypothetical protein
MREWFENKTVAIVGNAASISNKNYGKDIDAHQVVVRINRGIQCCARNYHLKEKFGIKLDVWMFNLYNRNLKLFYSNIKHKLIVQNFHKMQMNEDTNNTEFDFSYPNTYYLDLKTIFYPKYPSTGLRVLDYVSKCNPSLVNVYGFDWKETPTFYDKNASDINHDFKKEKLYCMENFTPKTKFHFHQ